MRTTTTIQLLATAAAALSLSLGARGGQQCFDYTVDKTTNWKEDMPVPQFDPALGTLTGVTISVSGAIEGSIRVEHLSENSKCIATATLSAELQLCDPDGVPIIQFPLAESTTDTLDEFDGEIDFDGPSGNTYPDLMAQDSRTYSPANIAPFIGTGTLLFATKAEGTSAVTGCGNDIQGQTTVAKAKVTVCYLYDEAGDEGCTPGYWKNHPRSWPPTGYAPGNKFDDVFGVSAFGKMTLMEVVDQGGGHIKALGRHAVAALLNAAHPGVESPYSVGEVIAAVQYAVGSGDYERVKDHLEDANELGCPLSGPAK